MACNLACPYCIENGAKSGEAMPVETAQLAVDWILHQADARPTRSININYYGGEPLMNLEVIESTATRLQRECTKRDLSFGFTLSTNGTLFTPEMAERLIPLGLGLVQVSVDGLPEVHDARRPTVDGRGSYDIIMKNLRAVVALLPVNLVGTYPEGGEGDVIQFCDLLVKENLVQRLASIRFEPENAFCDEDGKTHHYSGGCEGGGKTDRSNRVELIRALLERGIGIRRSLLGASGCALAMEHGQVVIDPDGVIYRCQPLVGHRRYAVGHVARAELDPAHHHNMTRELWQHCLVETDCPFVYSCGNAAGCRYHALLNEGDLWALNCQRDYLEQMAPELMKLERYRLEWEE
ncbi:MAG: radical SAM protein, partial [Planctomycetota bacterium]|jgi:uncharacterized protein